MSTSGGSCRKGRGDRIEPPGQVPGLGHQLFEAGIDLRPLFGSHRHHDGSVRELGPTFPRYTARQRHDKPCTVGYMAPNTALREARMRARLSQGELARMIREAGFRAGLATPCTERTVQRWEAGKVHCPQGRYLLALEGVLGQPAESLGFDADRHYGMDRDRMLADAGLDAVLPLPEPAERYGPLTGIWLSAYSFTSSGRGAEFTSRHHVMVLQRGARLMVRSLPASNSQLSMDLTVNGQVATGTWTEQTEGGGYYKGAVYHGAIQMLGEPTGRRLAGQWVGFGRENEVNTGPWSLTLVDGQVDTAAVERWNRSPE